jgi:hypothetical protein
MEINQTLNFAMPTKWEEAQVKEPLLEELKNSEEKLTDLPNEVAYSFADQMAILQRNTSPMPTYNGQGELLTLQNPVETQPQAQRLPSQDLAAGKLQMASGQVGPIQHLMGSKVVRQLSSGSKEGGAEQEMPPLTERMTRLSSGPNTAVDTSGLEPWKGDWVFGTQAVRNQLIQERKQPEMAENPLREILNQIERGRIDASMEQPTIGALLASAGAVEAPAEQGSEGASSIQTPLSGAEYLQLRGDARSLKTTGDLPSSAEGAPLGATLPENLENKAALKPEGSPTEIARPSLREIEAPFVSKGVGGQVVNPFIDPSLVSRPSMRANDGRPLTMPALTGHVVKGAMSQDRLSTQSLRDITLGIRELKELQGGGEMKIRLTPEHLGELQIRVSTYGQNVGLKVQASDESAKAVLEETSKHLKDALASQNLHLSSIDISVQRSDRPEMSGRNEGGLGFSNGDATSQQNTRSQGGSQYAETAEGRSVGGSRLSTGGRSSLTLASPLGLGNSSRARDAGRVDVFA